MDGERMYQLARELAAAKNDQDVPAALELFHSDMTLWAPALGTKACGRTANEEALLRFFATFPDYAVSLDGHAADHETLTCWGTAGMTMTGDRFGVIPTGRRAELPVFIQFTFKDDLIASERFFFDLCELCAQSGVSADAVRRTLFHTTRHSGKGDDAWQQKRA
ncbi:ester cyclase [Streptomyces sp. NPDC005551]|uniref:ester cyclase n=1 Tax=unclassified Streptomyces TaxID=2593676 RepID=UPI0033F31499